MGSKDFSRGYFANRSKPAFFAALALAIIATAFIGCRAFFHKPSRTDNLTLGDVQRREAVHFVSIDEALNEIELLTVPQDASGEMFGELKRNLASEMEQFYGSNARISSAAPKGNAGKGINLSYDEENNTLS